MSSLREKIEALCFHTCRVHSSPFHILCCQLRVGCGLGLDSDRLDRRWPIDWFLGADHIGHPVLQDCQIYQTFRKAFIYVLLFRPVHHLEGLFLGGLFVGCGEVMFAKKANP
jgi:hypothetical protein